jgi:membrane fusion protein (multidrug efflux system)
MKFAFLFWFNLCLLAVALSGCGKSDHSDASAGPRTPVQEVGVVTLTPQQVAITEELPGRTTAFRISDVRPQVNGIILKRMFTEGSEVTEGQQLYQIDPASYQAAYDSTKAALAKAEATLAVDRLTEQRQKKLADTHVIAPQDYDTTYATMKEAEADVALNKASVETAHISQTYTKVLSPISGRIGRSSVTEGALVTNGQTTALATVQQLDPIYVDLTQSSSQLLRVNQQAILVPQRGVTRNQQGQPTALVVGANNKVELRTLHTERTIGENWLVTGGLSAGDKVIIDGLQKVAPGAEVKTIALTADGYPVARK